MASYSKRMVYLLIVMYALTLLLSVATESQSNKSPLREVSCTTQVRKKYPLSRLRQILLARDFRSTAKCQYMKNEILIVTRDLGKNGGVWEAIVNKTVRGLGLCVFYTCQLSRLRRESHACGLKTSISRRLTLTGRFLTPDWKMWVVAVLLDTISKNI